MHLGGPRGHAGPRGGFGAQESRWAAGGGGRGGGAVQEEGAERREEGPGKIWSVVDFSLVVPQQVKHRVTI